MTGKDGIPTVHLCPDTQGLGTDIDPRYALLLSPDENKQVGISDVARMSILLKGKYPLC
jgi:hypothetical protein